MEVIFIEKNIDCYLVLMCSKLKKHCFDCSLPVDFCAGCLVLEVIDTLRYLQSEDLKYLKCEDNNE